MNKKYVIKFGIVFLILLACFQIIFGVYSWKNCLGIEDRILLVSDYISENDAHLAYQDVLENYPLVQFLKDTYINASISKDMILGILILIVLSNALWCLYFFILKKNSRMN